MKWCPLCTSAVSPFDALLPVVVRKLNYCFRRVAHDSLQGEAIGNAWAALGNVCTNHMHTRAAARKGSRRPYKQRRKATAPARWPLLSVCGVVVWEGVSHTLDATANVQAPPGTL